MLPVDACRIGTRRAEVAELDLDALRQRLAAIEHQRWADWQRWVHEQCKRQPNGDLVIPAALVERWERQIATPYDQLSEAEQRSDMGEVDRYWPRLLAEFGVAGNGG